MSEPDHKRDGRPNLERDLASLGDVGRRTLEQRRSAFEQEFSNRVSEIEPDVAPGARVIPLNDYRYWLYGGVAAVAVLLLALSSGFLTFQDSDPAQLALARGEVMFENAFDEQDRHVSRILTREDAYALVEVDNARAGLFIDESSVVEFPGNRRVLLESGRVWFSVDHGDGNFHVDIGAARVTVLGTSFAVERTSDQTRVYLAHGGVLLTSGDNEVQLQPDMQASVGADHTIAVQTFANTTPPAWVVQLYRGYESAHRERYFPSMAPGSSRSE